MALHDPDFPWMFRRDDIDILEDELEDLHEAFHHEDHPSYESAILREPMVFTNLISNSLICLRNAMNSSSESVNGKQLCPSVA